MTNDLETVQSSGTEVLGTGRSGPKGRTRKAIDLMVFEGMTRDDAATRVGMTAKSLREAFGLPTVKAYYAMQCEVLRSGERARSLHALMRVRDHAPNMPAVAAAKALLEEDDVRHGNGVMQRAPGLQIVITQAPQTALETSHGLPNSREAIDITPETPLPQR